MENNFNPHIKKDQFGPRSIEEVKGDMQRAKQRQMPEPQPIKTVNNQPQNSDGIKNHITNMNNLRNDRLWK